MGPLLIDIEGITLNKEDISLLQHEAVAGLILFERNCESPEQVKALVKAIHELNPQLLVVIDQEGGRVRRLKESHGFAPLGPLHDIGQLYDQNPDEGQQAAYNHGLKMATQVRSLGIDMSLAPVCDLFNTTAKVIGNRAFHHDAKICAILAKAYIRGMHDAGMKSMAKHFPGHGSVSIDSHEALPIDDRSLQEVLQTDAQVFSSIASEVDSIMPAHILYPQVDAKNPVGFSKAWLDLLKQTLDFKGIICTDDVGAMIAAVQYGTPMQRVEAALKAGADLVLFCNNRADLKALFRENAKYQWPLADSAVAQLKGYQPIKPLKIGCPSS